MLGLVFRDDLVRFIPGRLARRIGGSPFIACLLKFVIIARELLRQLAPLDLKFFARVLLDLALHLVLLLAPAPGLLLHGLFRGLHLLLYLFHIFPFLARLLRFLLESLAFLAHLFICFLLQTLEFFHFLNVARINLLQLLFLQLQALFCLLLHAADVFLFLRPHALCVFLGLEFGRFYLGAFHLQPARNLRLGILLRLVHYFIALPFHLLQPMVGARQFGLQHRGLDGRIHFLRIIIIIVLRGRGGGFRRRRLGNRRRRGRGFGRRWRSGLGRRGRRFRCRLGSALRLRRGRGRRFHHARLRLRRLHHVRGLRIVLQAPLQVPHLETPLCQQERAGRTATAGVAIHDVGFGLIELFRLHAQHIQGDMDIVAYGALVMFILEAHIQPLGAFNDNLQGLVKIQAAQRRLLNEIYEFLFFQAHQDAVGSHGHRGIARRIGDQGFFPETVARHQVGKLDLLAAGRRCAQHLAMPFLDDEVMFAGLALADDNVAFQELHRFQQRKQ